jgi:hypothetical protein
VARTTITKTALTRNGSVNAATAGVYQAFDQVNGMQVNAGEAGKTILHVKNTNAATRTVTVRAGAGGHLGMAWMAGLGDQAVVVGATTGDAILGPFESARFEQADGMIYVDADAAAGLTIAAFEIPAA